MDSFHRDLIELLRERNELLKENNLIMASLDTDVQTATTLLNELVAALGSAGSGVSAADQTALETAISAAQAALPSTSTPPAAPATVPAGSSDAQVPTVPEAPAEPVVTDPAVA